MYNSLLLTAKYLLDALSLNIFSDFGSMKRSHLWCFQNCDTPESWEFSFRHCTFFSSNVLLKVFRIESRFIAKGVFSSTGMSSRKIGQNVHEGRVLTQLSMLPRDSQSM